MMEMLRKFWNDESGQGLVEYILVIALIAIGMFVVLRYFRKGVGNVYNVAVDSLRVAPT